MLATVSRDDAARLLAGSVEYVLGQTGAVVEIVCDAAEQMSRALTIEEADTICVAINRQADRGEQPLGEQSDQDRWLRVRGQLLDRTITGAPETVPIVAHDLAVLCACFERRARAFEPRERMDSDQLLERCRQTLPPEQRAIVDADEKLAALVDTPRRG